MRSHQQRAEVQLSSITCWQLKSFQTPDPRVDGYTKPSQTLGPRVDGRPKPFQTLGLREDGYPKPFQRPGPRADTQYRLYTLFHIVYMQFAFWCELLLKTSNASFVVKKRSVNYTSITITTFRIILDRMTGLPLASCSERRQHTTVTFYYLCWHANPTANHVSLLCKYGVAEFYETTHPRHCILCVPCTGSQKVKAYAMELRNLCWNTQSLRLSSAGRNPGILTLTQESFVVDSTTELFTASFTDTQRHSLALQCNIR
jgi:hypothetical protein